MKKKKRIKKLIIFIIMWDVSCSWAVCFQGGAGTLSNFQALSLKLVYSNTQMMKACVRFSLGEPSFILCPRKEHKEMGVIS